MLLQTLTVGSSNYQIFSLTQAEKKLGDIAKLPKSLKVLLENLLRFEDQHSVKTEHIYALAEWLKPVPQIKKFNIDLHGF